MNTDVASSPERVCLLNDIVLLLLHLLHSITPSSTDGGFSIKSYSSCKHLAISL